MAAMRGSVWSSVHLDGFKRVFFGSVVVFEPGVGGGGEEDRLCVVEHEAMIRIAGKRQLRQGSAPRARALSASWGRRFGPVRGPLAG